MTPDGKPVSEQQPILRLPKRGRVCLIDGCSKPVNARGLCGMHYYRWRVNGDPLKVKVVLPHIHPETCTVAGCNRPYLAKGLCREHYEGQPERRREKQIVSRRLRTTPRGRARNAAWNAVRTAIKRGQLQPLPCESCGISPAHAHHDSYLPEDRLAVRWLCTTHHLAWHKVNKPAYPLPAQPMTITSDTPIEVLRLSARSYNALLRAGIETVGQLRSLSTRSILQIKGIGPGCVKQIAEALSTFSPAR